MNQRRRNGKPKVNPEVTSIEKKLLHSTGLRSPWRYVYQSNMDGVTYSLTCISSLLGDVHGAALYTTHQNATVPPYGIPKYCRNTVYLGLWLLQSISGFSGFYFVFTRILDRFWPFSNQFYLPSICTCKKKKEKRWWLLVKCDLHRVNRRTDW